MTLRPISRLAETYSTWTALSPHFGPCLHKNLSLPLCLYLSLSLSSHRGSVHDPAKIFPPSVRNQQVLSVKTPAGGGGGAEPTSGGSTWKVTDARTNESGWMDVGTD